MSTATITYEEMRQVRESCAHERLQRRYTKSRVRHQEIFAYAAKNPLITQSELAAMFNLSRQAISKIMRGEVAIAKAQ